MMKLTGIILQKPFTIELNSLKILQKAQKFSQENDLTDNDLPQSRSKEAEQNLRKL